MTVGVCQYKQNDTAGKYHSSVCVHAYLHMYVCVSTHADNNIVIIVIEAHALTHNLRMYIYVYRYRYARECPYADTCVYV